MTALVHDLETAERFSQFLNCTCRQNLEQFVSFHKRGTKLVQLSAGPFSGTVLNADFPLISVQLERCNQDFEKEVFLGENELAFTVCMHSDCADVPCKGSARESDCVIVQTPIQAKLSAISPPKKASGTGAGSRPITANNSASYRPRRAANFCFQKDTKGAQRCDFALNPVVNLTKPSRDFSLFRLTE